MRPGLPREARAAAVLLAPGLAMIALFFLLPVVAALVLSFTDFDLYALADAGNARFVGASSPTRSSGRRSGTRSSSSSSAGR